MTIRAGLCRQLPLLITLLMLSSSGLFAAEFNLEQAVAAAQKQDPWWQGSVFRQQMADAESLAALALPNPKVSFGVANLALNSVDFGQEPMSQITLAINQQLPRGKTRQLQQQQWQHISQQQPHLRANRRANLARQIAHLWLETYQNLASIRLIEKNRGLFEQLLALAQSSYTSGFGKTRQQDVVRAQVELTQLEDRLQRLQQHSDDSKIKLAEYLAVDFRQFTLAKNVPTEDYWQATKVLVNANSKANVNAILLAHPQLLNMEENLAANSADIQLAKQQFKPQWGINGQYGYRDDDPAGKSRSDFISLKITVDMPLFNNNRQQQQVRKAVAAEQALQTDKVLLQRALQTNFKRAQQRLKALEKRQALFENHLLKETQDQTEIALSAYTHDDGDFTHVVRAQIDALNTRLDFLTLGVNRLKTLTDLRYFLAANSEGTETSLNSGQAFSGLSQQVKP